MDNSVREALESPFPSDLIRTRRGSFGRELRYVEVVHYVRRLNAAFAGDWSFEILEHRLLDTEAVVLGKLTAGSVTKTAFGGSAITLTRESGEQLSISDDLKAAASDSLKKACSLFGVGLELYLDQTSPSENPAEIPRRLSAASSGPTPGEDTPKLTGRQLRAIQGLSTQAEISEEDLGKWVRTTYGLPVEELDRRQASEVITKINQSLAGGNGNGGNGRAAGGVA